MFFVWKSLVRKPLIAAAIMIGTVASAGTMASSVEAQTVPRSQMEMRLSFAPIVENAAPAVVNVFAKRMVTQRPQSPFANDPFFRRFFGDNIPGSRRQRQRQTSSLGSGVIVDPSGLVVTNNHVIKDASEIKIVLSDKREFDAEIVLKDDRTDLAILRIDLDGRNEIFPFLEFANSDNLLVGDLVLAIGNPFGVGQTVTSGIVSALARTRVGVSDYQFFIQTDAAINPGNSGGALVDMNGRLVGVNTAIFSKSGGSNGIGFAIPANMVRFVVDASDLGDVVERPWLGASFQGVTSDIAESFELEYPHGALITEIVEDGPFDRAGFRVGDLLLRMDGQRLASPEELGYRLGTKSLGEDTTFLARRGTKRLRYRIRLVPPPETIPRDERDIEGRSPLAGARIANLSPALAAEIGADETKGVVLLAIARRSSAARFRFRAGDIIVSINGTQIENTKSLARITARNTRLWRFVINRGGRTVRFAIGG